jgi:hypothetical protein
LPPPGQRCVLCHQIAQNTDANKSARWVPNVHERYVTANLENLLRISFCKLGGQREYADHSKA